MCGWREYELGTMILNICHIQNLSVTLASQLSTELEVSLKWEIGTQRMVRQGAEPVKQEKVLLLWLWLSPCGM